MRIESFQNIPAVLQSLKTGKSPLASSGETEKSSSSVSLSSFGEVLQSLQRETAQTTAARGGKVNQLAQQAQKGSLQVDLDKLAASLIQSDVIDTKG
jgi:flagellar biosynthesis anti-sigma factor FlgM